MTERLSTKTTAADSKNHPNTTSNDSKNPFAYLDRSEFTSERFKIEVRGLPKYYGISELKRFLIDKLGLNLNKIKPPKKSGGWVYICFRSDEDRAKAITAINGIHWKNSTLTAQVAKPAPDPFVKRKLEQVENNGKKQKVQDDYITGTPAERIKSSTTPLWNVPYEDQLKLKHKEMKQVLIKLGEQLAKQNTELHQWIESQKKNHDGMICDLMPILQAETINGYRNKCEFTIGKGEMNGEPTIGFRLASYASGCTSVGPVDELQHIPPRMIEAVKVLEKFVQKSNLPVFNPVDQSGHWRQLTARTTRTDQLMLIIGVHPQNLSAEALEELKLEIREFFVNGDGMAINVTSLYFETIKRRDVGGSGGTVLSHLSGSKYIEEQLLSMTFRVSPRAFFQINTLGAEILYKAAIDLAQPTVDTTVLDICCGTGTIGIAFAKHCKEILGLEMVEDAICDAKENIKLNNIENCEFFVGKAEDILAPVIQRATSPNLIAIVDPPRAGLHQRALVSLRKTKKLNKLVYISCDPNAAIRNLIDLARPTSKQYLGDPLVPVRAVSVDMFPHTKHCELVIYLERLSATKNVSSPT